MNDGDSTRHRLRTMLQGSLRPADNDSALPARRAPAACPHDADGAATATTTRSTCRSSAPAPAAACWRSGWRGAAGGWSVLETGPFWDPDRDWVSDEAGSHQIYWTDKRVIGGRDPVELGKNNSGHGVGGSMVHYAGYCPRFHPSDFEVRSRTASAPTGRSRYEELKPHYERLELRAAGRRAVTGPGATRTAIPHAPHPIAGGAEVAWAAPGRAGSRCASARLRSPTAASATARTASTVASACRAARSTPRPRRWSPTSPTRSSTAPRSAPTAMVTGIELDGARAVHRRRLHPRRPGARFQRADAVAVAGYSIETPRLLLHSTSRAVPATGSATATTRSAAT